ncbi:MAG: radical SAM/Cys-rich domain protein [Eggerthellaceae bacterium]|nr:radical SAM/Cys-rich domain protein [Eggerthellaceae bacterium]
MKEGLSQASLIPSEDASQIPDANKTIHEQIREYYGQILAGSDDLKTNATCCSESSPPKYVLDVMPDIADEVIEHFYGCGSPIPPALEGCTVLDLGCGSGRDVYILSALVGETGRVIGVDMTPAQLELAERYKEEQSRRFGHQTSNVTFLNGFIEDLEELGIEDDSVDLVVSNCVINLTPFKEQVFKEIHRVLKPGGELYFSDVFSDRRLPEEVRTDPVLRGECLGGAIYLDDFRRMLRRVGFDDFLIAATEDVHIADLAMETKVGFVRFKSHTIRAIKCDGLEDAEENYRQTATYQGTIPEMPRYFDLTEDIRLIKGRPHAIGGNMAKMLEASRYGEHFKITKPKEHAGRFDAKRAQEAVEAKRRRRSVGMEELDQALSRIGAPSFEERVSSEAALTSDECSVLQVNITYKCNLACAHCYLECSPASDQMMDALTMSKVLDAFDARGFTTLDITGGSPELNPDFEWFLGEAAKRVRAKGGKLIVRSNLTLLEKPEHEHLMRALADAGAQLNVSVPYFDPSAMDGQRGEGTFRKAMSAIAKLNALGYGEDGLELDVAYNVSGPFLPPPQDLLEDLYHSELSKREGVSFNNLFAFNNWPLGRFAQQLMDAQMLDEYLELLVENFNALAVQRLMCKDMVNVDVDGRLYDCEVNHVLGLPIQVEDAQGARDATVDDLLSGPLPARCVRTNAACYSCAAGSGSSCGGSLVASLEA